MSVSRIKIREGTARDFAAVGQMQRECAEAAQWPLGDYSGFGLLVAEFENTPAGFCWWRQASGEEAELLNLCVIPSMRRRGIARAFLQALRDTAKGDIFLEVAENNTAARKLYCGSGWIEIGTRPGYYPNGVNAVVMKNRSW